MEVLRKSKAVFLSPALVGPVFCRRRTSMQLNPEHAGGIAREDFSIPNVKASLLDGLLFGEDYKDYAVSATADTHIIWRRMQLRRVARC
jgi:hypothetical protein